MRIHRPATVVALPDIEAKALDDLDTTIAGPPSAESQPGIESNMTVVWTILAHPEPDRVGERAPVPELLTDSSASTLSRSEPIFCGVVDEEYRPLADGHLSRSPLQIRREDGVISIQRADHGGEIEVDGQVVSGSASFGAERLDFGVVITLAGRVALLLHRSPLVLKPPTTARSLVGFSARMLRTRQEIRAAARNPLPTLILGETGTGKELAARAVHDESSRADQPFVAVNMASIPSELAAAELFGADAGAFTGARARHGLFQQAHRGTLFMDEIGAIDSSVQALLLRVLEDGQVRRLGSEKTQEVDVHVVAATDEPLESRIVNDSFRRPLYERLRGSVVELPPLRERRDDIGRLLYLFLQEELEQIDRPQRLLTKEGSPWLRARTVAAIALDPLPGNVRQLKLLASRMVAGFVDHEHVSHSTVVGWLEPLETASPASAAASPVRSNDVLVDPPSDPPAYRSPDEVGEEELVTALRSNRWKILGAARQLGVSRTSLYSLIEKSPHLRKGSELTRSQIEQALDATGGNIGRAATELEVSKRALQMRLKELQS